MEEIKMKEGYDKFLEAAAGIVIMTAGVALSVKSATPEEMLKEVSPLLELVFKQGWNDAIEYLDKQEGAKGYFDNYKLKMEK